MKNVKTNRQQATADHNTHNCAISLWVNRTMYLSSGSVHQHSRGRSTSHDDLPDLPFRGECTVTVRCHKYPFTFNPLQSITPVLELVSFCVRINYCHGHGCGYDLCGHVFGVPCHIAITNHWIGSTLPFTMSYFGTFLHPTLSWCCLCFGQNYIL